MVYRNEDISMNENKIEISNVFDIFVSVLIVRAISFYTPLQYIDSEIGIVIGAIIEVISYVIAFKLWILLKKKFNKTIVILFFFISTIFVISTFYHFGVFSSSFFSNTYNHSSARSIYKANVHSSPAIYSHTIYKRKSGSIDVIGTSWRKYNIKIGNRNKLDYWVKVRFSNGREGWVFGGVM